ncbi:MAG: 3-deoxy-D-manno-octulosonic acid transferase [Alphaproteobacteria bacterium]
MIYRAFIGKEDKKRLQERYGYASHPRPKGKVFWFHGASIGECLSFLPVLNLFEKKYPSHSFLITSGTQASAELLQKKLSKRCIHQYLPLDHPLWVYRFLSYWQPNACFWTESDFWPNMITKASRFGPLFLLNGRFSSNTAARWSMCPSFIRRILKCFSVIFPQSFSDFKNFKRFYPSNLKMVGNLKYEGQTLDVPLGKVHALEKQIGKRPLWIVSNTHPGEEEIVLGIHKRIKDKLPKSLLLILIPRHPKRAGQVAELIHSLGFSFIKRSDNTKIEPHTDVLIVDSLGELGTFYSLSSFVIMGGSFVSGIGGHNVLEPARLGVLPIFGPHMKKNQDLADFLLKNKSGIQVRSVTQLEKVVTSCLKDTKKIKQQSQKAEEILKNVNILPVIVTEIQKYLND